MPNVTTQPDSVPNLSIHRFWLNGEFLDIDWQSLYSFIHDLPEVISEENVTRWLDVLYEADDHGSAWSHQLAHTLFEIKRDVLRCCDNVVASIDSGCGIDLEVAWEKFWTHLSAIDSVIERIEAQPVAVWTSIDDPKFAESLFKEVEARMAETYLKLCHVKRERSLRIDETRVMKKECNRLIQEISKKRKRRKEAARPGPVTTQVNPQESRKGSGDDGLLPK